ncbi:MAG: adenosylhomocysteinase [Trueperaceae bacterium]|nr:adenosylhomocysteinase [Trueperaceae bacterium]
MLSAHNQHTDFSTWLDWTKRNMPLTRDIGTSLPSFDGVRLACSVHLDIKMVPAFEALLARGAKLFLATCNPTTVRDDVVEHLQDLGADTYAWRGMSDTDYREGIRRALNWRPTHSCEMGADITVAAHAAGESTLRCGLEATGSGINRLAALSLRYPVFNWDDLPIKEGLHNRYLVGLSTWQSFCERTMLSLHGKHVVVVGFGLVGQGVADVAKAFGATVSIVERDPSRALQARYAGWPTGTLADFAPQTDVLVTATGVRGIVGADVVARLRPGCFVLNVGHVADEIDVAAFGTRRELVPFVEICEVTGKELYLFAGGSMANLTAGHGDSLNAFDLTLAVMLAGLGHIVTSGETSPAGIHPLPETVWKPVAARALA